MKKLLRTNKYSGNRILGGICGGFGNYLNFDPNIIRFIFVLLSFFGFFSVIAYILMWIIIPEDIKF
jgi:phage shock protein PspC (stress-responsive transcriptional regulator)